MADNVAITAGTGTSIATDDVGGKHHQRVKLSLGADGTAVDAGAGAGAVGTDTQRVTLGSDDPAVTALQIMDDWDESDRAKVNVIVGQAGITAGAGVVAANTPRVTHASDDPVVTALAAGASTIAKAEDAASANGDVGVAIMAIRKATPANTSGTDGDYETPQMSAGRLWTNTLLGDGTNAVGVGQSAAANSLSIVQANNRASSFPRLINATFGTITRPANTTAYAANDAVSNNATAGSVTAQVATISDTNDEPIALTKLRLVSTDTGVAAKNFRAYLFNSDPTASTGVGGGDNAAWSQKMAGFIGTMVGAFTAFSDGSVAMMTPESGVDIITTPVSGAKTVYILLQTIDAFTPSANSTTFIGTIEGYQGRAA